MFLRNNAPKKVYIPFSAEIVHFLQSLLNFKFYLIYLVPRCSRYGEKHSNLHCSIFITVLYVCNYNPKKEGRLT